MWPNISNWATTSSLSVSLTYSTIYTKPHKPHGSRQVQCIYSEIGNGTSLTNFPKIYKHMEFKTRVEVNTAKERFVRFSKGDISLTFSLCIRDFYLLLIQIEWLGKQVISYARPLLSNRNRGTDREINSKGEKILLITPSNTWRHKNNLNELCKYK